MRFRTWRQVEFRTKPVEFGRTEYGIDRSCAFAASIRTSEQIVLATQGYSAQSAFGRGVVHLERTVIASVL
jgi:hypothetical protein